MSNPKYEYEVEVEEIRLLAGKYRFAAKPNYVIRRDSSGLVEKLPSPIGEQWGEDTDEAVAKVHAAMEEWIAERASSHSTRDAGSIS